MEQLFEQICNLSISASWLILAVLSARVCLRKASKKYICALWLLVGIRLAFPFSIESALSLVPAVNVSTISALTEETSAEPEAVEEMMPPVVTEGFNPYDYDVEGVYHSTGAAETIPDAEPAEMGDVKQVSLMKLLSHIWLAGIVCMLGYFVVSFVHLKRKLSAAVILKEHIWQREYVTSPFVFGLIRPRIYLPYRMEEESLNYVIAHENVHIKRRDHWTKVIAFLILSVYWFHPLVWLSYSLLCKDIEMACDEQVAETLAEEERKAYSLALLSCHEKRSWYYACPVGFGEVNVKERVIRVLNYKKPSFWMLVAVVVLGILFSICFLTNEKTDVSGRDANNEEKFEESSSKENVHQEFAGAPLESVNAEGDFDGNGLVDDVTFECYGDHGSYQNVLTVAMDNGETAEIIYEGRTGFQEDFLTLQTGKLRYSDRDCIVLQITDSASNYGSTDIHVLSVSRSSEELKLVEEATVLDAQPGEERAEKYKETLIEMEENKAVSCSSTQELVQFVERLGLNAVQIWEYTEDVQMYLYWDGNEWSVEEALQSNTLDSITYVRIDDFFVPVSYLHDGEQMLSGNMVYSRLPETLLNGMPLPESLSSRTVANDNGSIDLIASDGTWNFYPEQAEYHSYSVNNQPQQPEWTRYFQEKLEALHYDGPVIIRESTSFSWNGMEAAIVTASNVNILEWDESFVDSSLYQDMEQLVNENPSIYSFSVLFVQGSVPLELYSSYSEISEDMGSAYRTWEGEDILSPFLSALQYDADGNIGEFPVFTNMTGEMLIRNFRCQPCWLVADIDGDGISEIVFVMQASSALFSYCKVYEMEQSVVQERFHLMLN